MANRKRRTFTPEFKTEVVLEALRGESSQAELCRRHNLSEDPPSKWKHLYFNLTKNFKNYIIFGSSFGRVVIAMPLALRPA